VILNQIAFIGTGIMGGRMARRLAEAGRTVLAWNRDPAKLAPLKAHGVAAADSPSQAMQDADAVVVMLSNGPVVEQVLFKADCSGAVPVERLGRGTMVVVMSSIPVETCQEQAARLHLRSIRYVDAPVSGGEAGARDGTLAIMAGGDADDVRALLPLLSPLGRVTRVGPVGCGQLAKLANQVIVGAGVAALAEAMYLARAGGADPAAVRDALASGFADSTILRQHGLRMVTGNFVPGGNAIYQLKDLRTAGDLAAKLGADLPMLQAATRLFTDMVEHGDGELDHSGVLREVVRRAARPRVQ
jgi:3-hydroxyisobutyrate dehydrogenase-like beta-hydroxyacid dehydrogenase